MRLCRRVVCAAALLVGGFAAAQEPEYYPYEPEPEERIVVPLPDSALFYRAVQSADDLFGRTTDYEFSFVRARRRGLDYECERGYVNGAEVPWRYFTPLRTLGADERLFAGLRMADGETGFINGMRLFSLGESEPLPAGRAAAGFAGRSYLTALKGSYVGFVRKGWEYSAAVDGRTGRDLQIEGVFTHAVTAAFHATRRRGDDRRTTLFVVVPLSMRGLRSLSTEETFELTGDRLYNPAWGLQDGKVRNAHIRREFLPLAGATWYGRLTAATTFGATVAAVAGYSKYSTLGWYDARTPVPDNYRYLPSYTGDRETDEAWRGGDVRYTQIDWDELWAENRMAGGEAVYALEDRVERSGDLQLKALFTTVAGSRLTLHYGMMLRGRSSRNYKRMRDLLGASWLTDIDQFLIDDDTYGNLLQNDLRHPDRRIGRGDRFGYDYALREREAGVGAQLLYRADRFRFDAGVGVGEASVCRRGFYEKELFPGNGSYGRSRRLRFTPYLFKFSAGWAFSPGSYLGASVAATASLPDAEDLFVQPQYNNRTADGVRTRKFRAAEVEYVRTERRFDLRIAAFAWLSTDGAETRRYYDDLAGLYCDLAVTGIGMRGLGIEAAAEVRIAYRWRLSLAVAAGRYDHVRDPRLTILSDRDNAPVEEDAVSRMGGCRVGNAPQAEAFAELRHFAPHGWGFGVSAAYAGLRYAEPAFLRRTDRIAHQAAQSPEAFDLFTAQERLDDAFTLGASFYKTFYFGASRLTLSLMLHNLLNDRDTVYAAYESLRVRRTRNGDFYSYAPFETRRSYAYPRSIYLSVSYRF